LRHLVSIFKEMFYLKQDKKSKNQAKNSIPIVITNQKVLEYIS